MVDAAHRAGVEVVKHQTQMSSGAAKKVIPGMLMFRYMKSWSAVLK
jgi:sialic acid synthase SpsE